VYTPVLFSFPQSVLVNPFIGYYGVPALYNYFGYFGISALISSIYLLLKRERRSFIVIFWFYALLLYLFFGTVSYRSYEFILELKRFLIILTPPMALMIGLAVDTAYNSLSCKKPHVLKHNNHADVYRFVGSAMLSLAIAFLLINSIVNIPYIKQNNFIITQYFRELGAIVSNLPASSSVYLMTGLYNRNATEIPIYNGAYGGMQNLNNLYFLEVNLYSRYSRQLNDSMLRAPACDELLNHSYYIIINSDSLITNRSIMFNITKFVDGCGLTEVFSGQYPNGTQVESIKSVKLYEYIR